MKVTWKLTVHADWVVDCTVRANHRVPRGTPDFSNVGSAKKFGCDSVGLEPPTSAMETDYTKCASHLGYYVPCLNIRRRIYLKWLWAQVWG